MNKRDVIIGMSKDAGISVRQAEKAFNSSIEGIKGSLRSEERVTFSGFGSFEVRMTKGKKGRNPRTGAIITIPSKKRVKFNASKSLKDSL